MKKEKSWNVPENGISNMLKNTQIMLVINGNETPEKVHANILEQLFNYYRKSE